MYTTEGKKIVSTEKAPKAIGPYSQAILTTNLIFTAGQVGLDPATMELVEGGIEAQTRQVLTNLRHVLERADSGLNFVVKTTVFLQDMNDFARMNAVYAEFFPENPPARSTVQVAGLPKGALVEIECIALLKPGRGD
jgi:2-iminobutanoate/2-iminopropanoate deaminase